MASNTSLTLKDITQADAQKTLGSVGFLTNEKGCKIAKKGKSFLCTAVFYFIYASYIKLLTAFISSSFTNNSVGPQERLRQDQGAWP